MSSIQDIASSASSSAIATQSDPVSDLVKSIGSVVGEIFGGMNTTFAIIAFVVVVAMAIGAVLLWKMGPGFITGLIPSFSLDDETSTRPPAYNPAVQTQPFTFGKLEGEYRCDTCIQAIDNNHSWYYNRQIDKDFHEDNCYMQYVNSLNPS